MNQFTAPASLGGRRLYLDLDGVMADFDQHYLDLFGVTADSEDDDILWEKINAKGDFFATMPLCPDAPAFLNAIWPLKPIVLTACPKSNYADVATQKRQWVRNNLSPSLTVLPTAGGMAKPMFMHDAGDILIDDFERNCVAWMKAGGIPIQHRNFGWTSKLLTSLGDA